MNRYLVPINCMRLRNSRIVFWACPNLRTRPCQNLADAICIMGNFLFAVPAMAKSLRAARTSATGKLHCGTGFWSQGLLWAVHVERPRFLYFNGFCYGQCVFKFNAEIANGAIHLRMPQEELDSTQVARFLIDLGDLSSPH